MSKKISLITLQYVNNYGSILQTFASQTYLENKGYKVEIVNYVRENYRFNNLKKNMKEYYQQKGIIFKLPFVSDILTKRWEYIYMKRNFIFDKFRKDKIKFSREYFSAEELLDNPPIADFYCVGSDQVWNYLYNDGVLPEYFLNYAPFGKKKFSFASSFGVEQIEDKEKEKLIKEYLQTFSLITVRENSAIKILEKINIKGKYQILDPTLLLNKEQWMEKLSLHNTKKEKYLLLYQLNPCQEMNEFAKQISREKGLKLVIISNNIRMSISEAEIIENPEVEEFLNLILYSEVVITDSFHGTAFSLNFNKEFFSWMPSKYSTRLMSVLDLVGLRDRAFKENDIRWKNMKKIDYQIVNKILIDSRKNAEKLIMEVLSPNEK